LITKNKETGRRPFTPKSSSPLSLGKSLIEEKLHAKEENCLKVPNNPLKKEIVLSFGGFAHIPRN